MALTYRAALRVRYVSARSVTCPAAVGFFRAPCRRRFGDDGFPPLSRGSAKSLGGHGVVRSLMALVGLRVMARLAEAMPVVAGSS